MKKNPHETEIIKTLSKCSDIGADAESHYKYLVSFEQKFSENTDVQRIVRILNAMGNADRFLILDLLKEKDRCVCELEAALNKSQPAVSRHLKILESAELIRGWKHGKFTHYSLIKSEMVFFQK
ncbi:MAG: ArsR/SmtB family transcription factor, partial [Promethearchaeota archaeon]